MVVAGNNWPFAHLQRRKQIQEYHEIVKFLWAIDKRGFISYLSENVVTAIIGHLSVQEKENFRFSSERGTVRGDELLCQGANGDVLDGIFSDWWLPGNFGGLNNFEWPNDDDEEGTLDSQHSV
jgi:hypothetical protein